MITAEVNCLVKSQIPWHQWTRKKARSIKCSFKRARFVKCGFKKAKPCSIEKILCRKFCIQFSNRHLQFQCLRCRNKSRPNFMQSWSNGWPCSWCSRFPTRHIYRDRNFVLPSKTSSGCKNGRRQKRSKGTLFSYAMSAIWKPCNCWDRYKSWLKMKFLWWILDHFPPAAEFLRLELIWLKLCSLDQSALMWVKKSHLAGGLISTGGKKLLCF